MVEGLRGAVPKTLTKRSRLRRIELQYGSQGVEYEDIRCDNTVYHFEPLLSCDLSKAMPSADTASTVSI